MEKKDYFKDIYKDFFESNIEINDKESSNVEEVEVINNYKEIINKMGIDKESKELLIKITDYMKKYKELKETNYVPFNIIVVSNNSKTCSEVSDLLYKASEYFSYVNKGNKLDVSLYKLDKDKIFDGSFINISNIKGLNLLDDKELNKVFLQIEEYLNNNDKKMMMICGSEDEVTNLFLGREKIKNNYFKFVIKGINPDIQDIYNNIIDKVNIDDNLKVVLLDYITNTYNCDLDYSKYQDDLIQYISFNKDIPKIEINKSTDEIFVELNELVGLDKVKKVLYDLVDVIKFKDKVGDDIKIKDMNLHMVFLGNPGTGKTTIARMVANILYNLGYIKENKLVEVSSKDLVAEYVGQTGPKTMSVIEKAMNGVLFIDEAYSLADKGDKSFNGEAIATLIQAMENYRDRLVVIFAGSTKEMQDFLDSNSGIVSRIGYTLEFDDYTTDELIEIFKGMVKKNGFNIKDDAINYLREIINNNRNTKNFGNARFVRNIYEKTVIKHASNTKDKKRSDILRTITKNDICIDNLILTS